MSARLLNESTQTWLERLVSVGATPDVRANVQTILQAEIYQAQPQAG